MRQQLKETLAAAGITVQGNNSQGQALCVGLPRPHTYWHCLSLGTSIAAGQTFTFFDKNETPDVTNWPQAGSLPDGEDFILKGVAISVIPGIDADSSVLAGSALSSAAATPATIHEQVKNILVSGVFNLNVNNRDIVRNVKDLTRFPYGGGIHAAAGVTNTSATIISTLSNGVPMPDNYGKITPQQLIEARQPVRPTIRFGKQLSLTTGGTLVLAFIGTRYVEGD